jgi:hypothetical protein
MTLDRCAPASRWLVTGALVIFAALPARATSARGSPRADAFEGVWRITKVTSPGPNGHTDIHPQPSLEIFYRGYFTIIRDNASEPRTASPAAGDPAKLTGAEKIARYEEWAPFGASGGTYEVRGDTLVTHNIVAKQVGGMSVTEEATVTFEGRDAFVATAKVEPGVPAGRQTTYTRLR